ASVAGIATAASIHAWGGAAVVLSAAASSISRFSSLAIYGSRRIRRRGSSIGFQFLAQGGQGPGDTAGDRAGRQPERLGDRLVALVAGEEAVQDLLLVLGEAGQRLTHDQRLVDGGERLVVGAVVHGVGRRLVAGPSQPVQRGVAR